MGYIFRDEIGENLKKSYFKKRESDDDNCYVIKSLE